MSTPLIMRHYFFAFDPEVGPRNVVKTEILILHRTHSNAILVSGMEDQPPVPMILNLEFVHFWLAAALLFPPRAPARTHHRAEVCNYYFADFYHSVDANWFLLKIREAFVFTELT